MSSLKKIVLACAAVALVIGSLWITNRVVTPKEATWEDVKAEAQQGGYRLLTTGELAQAYRQNPAGMLLVDTRQDWEYRAGHITGALNFPLEPTWWSRWRNKGDLARFLGPDKNRLLVFY
ncbi:MAG: rhodanese-like domain-containing protein [Desulfarculus sp.]|jgi:hypothetical protein|nr:MAG: rhodanese-like domain-containing protein [Desulfarculus sp.]